jgi:hypothetical protein
MLTIAAELDLLTGLFAVFAAILAERPMWFDHTLARRVGAFRSGHTATSCQATLRLGRTGDKLVGS